MRYVSALEDIRSSPTNHHAIPRAQVSHAASPQTLRELREHCTPLLIYQPLIMAPSRPPLVAIHDTLGALQCSTDPQHRSVIKSKVSANARKSARRSGRPCFRPKGLEPRVVPPPKRPSDEHLHLARSRTQQVQLTENQSKEMVFGRQLALLQATLQVNIPRSLTYNDAALRRCFANLGLPHHPPYSPQDVERYIDVSA